MMYLGNQAVGLATSIPIFADVAKIEVGTYIPTTDEDSSTTFLPNPFGEKYDFLIWAADTFTLTTDENSYVISGAVYKTNITDDQYDHYVSVVYKTANTATRSNLRASLLMDDTLSQQFRFYGPSGSKLKANTTYRYIIGKFKEVTPNA